MAAKNALQTINEPINQWGQKTFGLLKQEIYKQGIRHANYSPSPKSALNSLQYKTRKRLGVINRLGYIMPRHMIYVHKGVGSGTPIGAVGSTNRKAKPWFNPVIARRIDELADTVALKMGDAIIENILIK
jgi:hypothetical protein